MDDTVVSVCNRVGLPPLSGETLDSQPRMPMAQYRRNLENHREIDQTAADWGREGADITLVAVGKVFPPTASSGSRGTWTFGENKVREALKNGRPQSPLPGGSPTPYRSLANKQGREGLQIFDVIETVIDQTRQDHRETCLRDECSRSLPCPGQYRRDLGNRRCSGRSR